MERAGNPVQLGRQRPAQPGAVQESLDLGGGLEFHAVHGSRERVDPTRTTGRVGPAFSSRTGLFPAVKFGILEVLNPMQISLRFRPYAARRRRDTT